MASMAWHGPAKIYLERLGQAEWLAQGSPIPTKRKPLNRFAPSDYMRELIACLDRDDEEGFKARKMLEGYASAVGV